MRKNGLSIEQITSALTTINDEMCTPPMSADDVRRIAEGKRKIKPDTPSADDFEVETLTPEQEAEGAAARARNKVKWLAGIEKAQFCGQDAFEQLRRDKQKAENVLIGQGEYAVPTAEAITLPARSTGLFSCRMGRRSSTC
jgi:hypothetical protein